MKLHDALRCKNRLVGRLRDVRHEIVENNITLVGNEPDVDIDALMNLETLVRRKLIELKTAIARANNPIQHYIVDMIELRSWITTLRAIPTEHGLVRPRGLYGESHGEPIEQQAQLKKADVDEEIRSVEMEIAKIEAGLAEFNAKTEIDVDVPDSLMF